ncbi:hypothetical protein EV702DRAFT_1191288 [Suillus placidus]|uniref:F-box domain-containing protein n=1 Tax=Suillus placidus TaxID=48579 RepID=A0A9P7A5F3_9AGAM|nr:hypothetical protein EV702DRAFT_1191288 [Suillus placidus]
MTINNLPVELWLIIFSFAKAFKFSSNDLAALCRVCTYFHHAVVDSLYESITVDNSDVCTTLAECPHLAEKVKSFISTYPAIMVYDGPEVHLDNLTLALKNMTCLSTLKLIHSKKCYSSVLRYCDAKLHVFHCTYDTDFQFLSFLNRQDSIRDLVITGDAPRYDVYLASERMRLPLFLPTSLPHLTEVSAEPLFLNVLIPGRPVHTVRFKGQHAHTSSGSWELNRIVAHSTSIRNLGLDLTVWLPVFQISHPSIPKHVEEITLTGFATQNLNVYVIELLNDGMGNLFT